MISEKQLRYCCGKHIPLIGQVCGSWSLKHNEYYYCEDCMKKTEAEK